MTQEIIDSAKIIADNLKERKCCFVTVVNGYTIHFIREELKKLLDKSFVTFRCKDGRYMFKYDVKDLDYFYNGTIYG
jgi:hypothetical protein